ncbi:unnamed protein product [Symbiodinium natans]|uniref:Uncharacterized protein n=1 Tax=Symbiodinium natans TaxID=878477 RepID=A0A812T7T6_9DINO|nr:unnamed protein product [Symbiodinium natans]
MAMMPLTSETWWNFMQTHHAFLGILYFNKVDEGKDFSLLERRLFLGMAIFAAWFGVYLKYFYLRRWIPMFFDEVLDDLHLFPGDWLEDHLDSAVCSALGGAVDLLLGKEIVRSVLKKDWETKGGVRGFASSLATAYAALLVVGGVAHIFYVMVLKPKLQFKLLLKWVITVVLKLSVVETGILTVKALAASRGAAKDEAKKT